MKDKGISIVIPLLNEEKNISVLAKEIEDSLINQDVLWECIWVDDGSTDNSWLEILRLGESHRGLKLVRNAGQATAIMAGIEVSKHDLVVTMDADLQNDPKDIPVLINSLDASVDVVCGYRVDRKDGFFTRKAPSLIANIVSRKLTGVQVKDLGCTLRIFRKDVLANTRLIGEMHRLLVIHLFLDGARIKEIPVNHRERLHGESKYGLERMLKFLADLLLAKAMFVMTSKPLYMFASLAVTTSLLSITSLITAVVLRLIGVKNYFDTSLISASFILFSTSLILVSIGLVAELIARQMLFSGARSQYRIASRKV